ncbi:MAG: hemolysin family protein [Phycisphaerae bacterium]
MEGILWAAAILSTALSSFFALTSNALRMFRRSQLEEVFSSMAGQRKLHKLQEHLKELRLTSSLCRSLANLVLVVAILGLLNAPRGSGWQGTVIGMVIAAVVIAVLGVGIPHAWAAYAGERIVAATFPVLMGTRLLLWPAVALMHALDLPIRRLTGTGDEDEENGDVAKMEILQAATEGRAEGAVDAEEVEMIESVMEFGETHAGEIMTPRTALFALSVDTPAPDAIRKIIDAGHSRVPAYEGDLDNIVGILYAKDMLQNLVESREIPLRKLLRKPFFVPETKLLDDLLREFKTRKFHIAVVLDEYGGTAGIVTIEDVLEEIVGDISDEYDVAEPELMTRVDERTAEVDGRMRVDELNDACGLNIPEDDDYDTIAGFLFSELGYIPAAGETLDACGARFTILAASDRKIDRVRVSVLELPTQTAESA